MDFSIAGAIDQSASMFLGDGEATHGKNQTLIVVQTHTNLFLMQVCVNRTGYETKAIEQSKTQVETMVHAHET